MRIVPVLTLLAVGVLSAGVPRAAIDPVRAKTIVEEAIRESKDHPATLAGLAWLDDSTHPEVAKAARRMLIDYGRKGFRAMRDALNHAKPEKQADIVAAMIEARNAMTTFLPPVYLPALEDALWIGTPEAKRLALPELGTLGYRSAVLPIIDSALEDPELVPLCVRTLGLIRDDRARFYLERVLNEGDAGLRESAAVSLAMIGNRAKDPLRKALRSGDRELRLTAARALLPVANEDDITDLFEYGTAYADDDPATTRAVLEAAQTLEELWELQRMADAPGAIDEDP